MILDFDKMGKTCEENLVKIKLVRTMNDKMKSKLCVNGLDVARQTKAIGKMQKVHDLLEKL